MSVRKNTDNNEDNNIDNLPEEEAAGLVQGTEGEEGTEKESQPVQPVIPEKIEVTTASEEDKKSTVEPKSVTPEVMEYIQSEMAKFIASQYPRVPGEHTIKEIYQEAELPKDDFLQDPVIFFAFSKYYAIWGDKRKGQQVATPYNRKIEFDTVYRFQKRGKTERGIEIVTISQAIIRSKKEAKWLDDHSLNGIKFFKNINDAKNVDVTLSEKMAEMQGMIGGMDDMKVIARAQMENISIENPDVAKIRQQLIQKLAYDAIENKKAKTLKTLEEHDQKDANSTETKKVEDVAAQNVYD